MCLSSRKGGELLQEEVCQAEVCGEVFPQKFFDQVEEFLTDQSEHDSWNFEDFGGQKLLADHVEIIGVE